MKVGRNQETLQDQENAETGGGEGAAGVAQGGHFGQGARALRHRVHARDFGAVERGTVRPALGRSQVL